MSNHLADISDNSIAQPCVDEDSKWMKYALNMAEQAALGGEVPVAAVCVAGGRLVSCAANSPIGRCDPTAHAEVLALRAAGKEVGNYRLPGVTMYVTLEPCAMCVGAIIHARIDRLVFAAYDRRTGSVCSVRSLLDDCGHNHSVVWRGGVLEGDSRVMLQDFFRKRR